MSPSTRNSVRQQSIKTYENHIRSNHIYIYNVPGATDCKPFFTAFSLDPYFATSLPILVSTAGTNNLVSP